MFIGLGPQQSVKARFLKHVLNVQAPVSKMPLGPVLVAERKGKILAGTPQKGRQSEFPHSLFFGAIVGDGLLRVHFGVFAGVHVPWFGSMLMVTAATALLEIDQGGGPDLYACIVVDETKHGVPARLANGVIEGAAIKFEMGQMAVGLNQGLAHGLDSPLLDRYPGKKEFRQGLAPRQFQ